LEWSTLTGEKLMVKGRKREKGELLERERASIHINFCCLGLAPLINTSSCTHSKRRDLRMKCTTTGCGFWLKVA
jgi:hypothetical protein